MKNIGLISAVMLIVIALSNNLSAGPVYAAKWERDGQAVLFYGDHHDTHLADEDRENHVIEAFCAELKLVNTKTLVLCEDLRYTLSSIFSYDDIKALDPVWDKKFMSATCNFAHAMSNQSGSHVSAQSIETRHEVTELIAMALGYNSFVKLSPRQERNKKAFDALKNCSLTEIFERPIITVESYSQQVDNQLTKSFFKEMAAAMRMRKTVLWNKIVADTGLSLQELDNLTIDTIVSSSWMNKAYGKLAIFLTEIAEPLARSYSEALDAEALWLIVGVQNPCSNIVMIAGWKHIQDLEKYLQALGFVKKHVEGQDYTNAYQAVERSHSHLKNSIDVQHASRVFPLDPLDWFGQYLFGNEIAQAQQQFDLILDTDRSEGQNQALCDYEIKVKELNNFKPVPLVSFETFKWIN